MTTPAMALLLAIVRGPKRRLRIRLSSPQRGAVLRKGEAAPRGGNCEYERRVFNQGCTTRRMNQISMKGGKLEKSQQITGSAPRHSTDY